MPRTYTTETTVYQFDELSDKAKEKARDWYREVSASDEWWEAALEDAQQIAALFGLTIHNDTENCIASNGRKFTRSTPAIHFSLYEHGSGACLTNANYAFKADALENVKAYAPTDETLHAIVTNIQNAQAPVFDSIALNIRSNGNYTNSRSMGFEAEEVDESLESELAKLMPGDFLKSENAIISEIRDFADWIYQELIDEYEYRNSAEVVDETIKANEYEFLESGERA